jgi:hypothetical protein
LVHKSRVADWRAERQIAAQRVDAVGGHPVAHRGGLGGTFEPLEFEGDLTVQTDLTAINSNTAVILPVACDNPISL